MMRSKKAYLNRFANSKTFNKKKYLTIDIHKDKQEKALDYALDIRKFEIELYWKRSTYFWALLLALATGFFISIKEGYYEYSFVLSNIGFIFFLYLGF